MKRLGLLSFAILAAAGCATATGTGESTASQSQHLDSDHARNLPHFRYVPPSSTGSSSGSGSGGSGSTSSPSWTRVGGVPDALYAGTSLLLTDGSVMVQNAGTSDWYKLTPDANGSYANGTWKQLASLPDGYAPLYFASAVLPDGRVIVEGGEYQLFQPTWSTGGAIYDPVADAWTTIAPPAGWTTIGDAQSIVLADGRFVLANCCTTDAAVLDPKTLTWTPFGNGKADIYDEEGWTLLPNKKILTVDANNLADPSLAEILDPRTGAWSSAGDTPVVLSDLGVDGDGSHELGPAVLRPDGTVFAIGATGHTAIYKSQSGRWTAGPDFPVVTGEGQLDVADGPASLMPNGHVLVVASAGLFNAPAHVFEFDGAALHEVPAHPGAAYDSSYNVNMLLLPTGEVMLTDFSNDVEIYGSAASTTCGQHGAWAPQLDDTCGLSTLQAGGTYAISGRRLNGLSQAVAYGDDAQAATNYPLVRITHRATGTVTFARTHGFSNSGIGRDNWSQASFDVPASAPAGDSDVVVIANGIASDSFRARVTAPRR